MKLKMRPATEEEIQKFKAHGCQSPVYALVAEMVYGVGSRNDKVIETTCLALLERQKMSGMGSCNMWGSRYRWALHTFRDLHGRKKKIPNIHGVMTHYFDTRNEGWEVFQESIYQGLRLRFQGVVQNFSG